MALVGVLDIGYEVFKGPHDQDITRRWTHREVIG